MTYHLRHCILYLMYMYYDRESVCDISSCNTYMYIDVYVEVRYEKTTNTGVVYLF